MDEQKGDGGEFSIIGRLGEKECADSVTTYLFPISIIQAFGLNLLGNFQSSKCVLSIVFRSNTNNDGGINKIYLE